MSGKPKIVVTGSNGQLGSELKELSSQHPHYDFVFLSRNEMPLNDNEIIQKVLQETQPTVLVNCAAYTAVDKAESEREDAFQINSAAAETMANYCASNNCKFIHISTDYVFDGSHQEPLMEDAAVHPINIYGESKLAGEKAIVAANPDAIIIRTSWVYSYYGKNFVKTIIRLMSEKESIHVVNDQWGSPTYAADLANVIMEIVDSKKWEAGIYHYSNDGVIAWFDFAKEIARLVETKCIVQPTTTDKFPTPAKRPRYSAMNKQKIASTFGLHIRPWQSSLKDCVDKLKEKSKFH